MDNETLQSIQTLRSLHDDFNDKEISEDIMNTIIDFSMKAANASNIQRYSMILLEDKKLIQDITGKKTAKRAIIYCLDYNRIMETAEYMGLKYDPGMDNWYDIISGIFDVSALAQTGVIAANSLGVDTLITNGVLRQNQKQVKKLLRLPEKYCLPVMAVLFGYNDLPKSVCQNRLSREFILHKNTYKKISVEQHERIVKEYDKMYPEYINSNHEHYLDYFYNDWCGPRSEEMKNDLKQAMNEAGFLLKELSI